MAEGWLNGQVALVTGGGSGIGRGVVRRFVREGARVGVLEHSPTKIEDLKQEFGDLVAPVQGDVTRLEDQERAVAETERRFGKLNILVGNAGIFDGFVGLEALSRDQISQAFDEVFAVNVKGYLLAAKAALPSLLETGGAIVFTVSNAGFYPAGGGPLYTASKHAVMGLIKELAYELAPRVRVNGVAPGGTVTDLRGAGVLGQGEQSLSQFPGLENLIRDTNPLHVVPTPDDHAWAYLLLASNAHAKAITGVVINSDGGLGVRGLTKLAGRDAG